MLRGVVVAIVVAVVAVACGGKDSSPTAPTPVIPSVAGSYSGSATIAMPELVVSATCPASTVVTQSGATVNIAPIVLGGQCGNMSIPLGPTTIDLTGAIDPTGSSGTYNDPSCGTYKYSASGGFFGRELRISLSATSATCYNMNLTVLMSR